MARSTSRPGPSLREDGVAAALGHPAQRDVLTTCIGSAQSVKDIATETGIPIATVYRQVNTLQEEGLLVIERSALTSDGKPYDLYRSRVTRASIEISIAGASVQWECDQRREDRLVGMWRQMRGLA